MPCPFCDLKKEKNWILRITENIAVILSNPRIMKSHLLVVPIRHVEKLSELSREESDELIAAIIEFQEKILVNIAPGCDIKQNYRPFIEDNDLKVGHLHIHLEPRFLNDELYEKCQIYQREIFQKLKDEEACSIMDLIGDK
jgi:ATP adenylyltransferase